MFTGMTPTEQAKQETKKAFISILRTFHGLLMSVGGVEALVKEHSGVLGLDSLGILDKSPDGATLLYFKTGRIQWKDACEDLLAIGEPTHVFAVKDDRMLGFRGSKGDVLIRFYDIQVRRLEGVLQCLKEEM